MTSEIELPRRREKVFGFFSDAGNLERLTPPWLRFEILTPRPIAMHLGRLIDYRLRLRGMPIHWQSEITVWDPPVRFVDEQRRGPYRSWVHEHIFEEENGATKVVDRVSYDHFGGWLVNRLLVARDLDRVFRYRRQKLTEIF